MEQRTYTFVKNVRGSLVIELDAYDASIPTKTFRIPFNVDKIVVPYVYALGLFMSQSALHQFEMGFFKVEDLNNLAEDAISKGLCTPEEFPEITSKMEVEKAILNNDMKKVSDILKRNNKVEIDNLVCFAKTHCDKLYTNVKNIIEQRCGVTLQVDE